MPIAALEGADYIIEPVSDPEIILLPGLDGTGELFAPLLAVMLPDVPRRIIAYPADQELSYEHLLTIVTAQMPADRPVVLVAESFSGPLTSEYAAARRGKSVPDGSGNGGIDGAQCLRLRE